MRDNPILYLPGGHVHEVAKARPQDGSGLATGIQPYRLGYGKAAKAARKKGVWKDYYEMYKQHAIVRAAIDKISKVATNTGYDFIPRDPRGKAPKREISKLKAFFNAQPDFLGELRKVYTDLMIYGDAFMEVVYDRGGRPSRLIRRAPNTILVQANRHGEAEFFYQFDPVNLNAEPVVFQWNEMIHFKLDDPDNDVYGLSPLESLKNAVATDLFAQSYNEKFFENSAVTGLIITIENSNPDEVERNRKWLEDNYVGPETAHAPIVLEGNVKVHKSVNSHNEMGFLEGRKFLIMEMLAVLDVPPVKLGIVESANRANSKEQDKTFRVESIDPLQSIIKSVINGQFVLPILGVEQTVWTHSESDTRDAIEQMDLWVSAIQNGILAINEVRAQMGKSDVPGGDVNYVMSPTGAVPVADLELYFKIPLPNTDKIPPDLHSPTVAHGPDGGLQGPNPTKPGPAPGAPAGGQTKSIPPAASLHGAEVWLAKAFDDLKALRQAYAYAVDAALALPDPRVRQAAAALEQAVSTDNQVLRHAYIERAEMFYADVRTSAQRTAEVTDEDALAA